MTLLTLRNDRDIIENKALLPDSGVIMDLESGGTGRASMCSTIAQMNEEFSFNGKLEEHLRIGFKLEFLSEALKSMEGDEVSAWVVGHLSPVANAETCVWFVNFQRIHIFHS